jgi:two-component system sensor histidine kinase BaeS
LKLLHKFFLAFFITNLAIVGLLMSLITSNLSSDFNEFVYQAENKHIKNTQAQLASLYQSQGSWQSIQQDVQVWRDIADPKPARRAPPPPKNNPPPPRPQERSANDFDNSRVFPETRKPPKPKPRPENRQVPQPNAKADDFLKTGRRLSLYDAHQHVIVGKQFIDENPRKEAIMVNGEIVGWLGLVPSNAIKDSPASEFLAKQLHTFYVIAGAALLFAFIMALLLSRHLSQPIKTIIAGTNTLIKGDYKKRLLKTTQDELGTLTDNFNNLAKTLEKNQKNRFQWMSDTSHELRTPLTILKAQLSAIQDGLFKADGKRIELFIEQIDNLSHIVNDLYQLSSSDAGALTYEKNTVQPIHLMNQVLSNFEPKLNNQRLTLDKGNLHSPALSSANLTLLADKDRLRQLFSNLLENSCRYTNAGGKIQVQASVDAQHLKISIKDSSPGVPHHAQEKLFERFYRVEQSRNREHGGSGLGLSLCQQIVEAHQGTIKASDSDLGGLCMTLTFPLTFNK